MIESLDPPAEALPAAPSGHRERVDHSAGDAPWVIALILTALAAGVWFGAAPLADPDLPMHLAIGEWIVHHRAVPYTEPFAWTRMGAPYYAYSWLPQTLFFVLLRSFGPGGLHALAALAGIAVTLAGAMAGRAFRLPAAGVVLLGVASAFVAVESTPFLRPQLLMHAVVPLCWAAVAWLADDERTRPAPLAAIVVLSALAASIHITFPVVAATLSLIPSRSSWSPRMLLTASAAVAAGWCLSPYGFHWLQVFQLNFAPNVLNATPSIVGELAPGFAVNAFLGGALILLPLFTLRKMAGRERLLFGALWFVGLLVFSRVFKGLGPWWWCTTPMVALLLRRLPRPSSRTTEWAFAVLLAVAMTAFGLTNIRLYRELSRYEAPSLHGSLPSIKSFAVEPLARWLEESVRPAAGGKLLTTFNYGSYLKWRLPQLSESIDSRGIFPDSAAQPDAPARGGGQFGPWQSADLAIVPLTYPVAAALDEALDWRRVAVAESPPWNPEAPRAGLWVRRSWWARSRRAGRTVPADETLRLR